MANAVSAQLLNSPDSLDGLNALIVVSPTPLLAEGGNGDSRRDICIGGGNVGVFDPNPVNLFFNRETTRTSVILVKLQLGPDFFGGVVAPPVSKTVA